MRGKKECMMIQCLGENRLLLLTFIPYLCSSLFPYKLMHELVIINAYSVQKVVTYNGIMNRPVTSIIHDRVATRCGSVDWTKVYRQVSCGDVVVNLDERHICLFRVVCGE